MRDAPFRILLAPEVARDLISIFESIAAGSPDNASAFIGNILTTIEGLAEFPTRQLVLDQPPAKYPLRKLPVGNYIIYFRTLEDSRIVRIVRVIHGARRQPSDFN